MQLIVELQVKIGKGKLGVFTDELGRHGCTLRRLLLGESAESHEVYEPKYSIPIRKATRPSFPRPERRGTATRLSANEIFSRIQ
jgi:hypothetical protein